MKKNRKIKIASSRGFCAGVERAINIVEEALQKSGAPLYVRHDIVHNDYVVNSLKSRGVVFVEELSDIPKGSCVIFSAHGVAPDVEVEAETLGLSYIDATCPIVKKIHRKAVALKNDGYTVLLIGHKVHPEIIGTLGHLGGEGVVIESVDDVKLLSIPSATAKITYLTQTTLSPDDVKSIVSALEERFPNLKNPDRHDVCYATLERQKAVRDMAEECDVILVLGSPESSNSNRLKEVANFAGAEAYLINSYKDIPENVLAGDMSIGVTAGASAPEVLVEEVLECLRD
jgi:4-hydroxy-3-methylbut-2-enyl diphosphate reductase